ncbi:hypothetical protein ANTPLA_LOCUS7786 [Anthophora plagiata]
MLKPSLSKDREKTASCEDVTDGAKKQPPEGARHWRFFVEGVQARKLSAKLRLYHYSSGKGSLRMLGQGEAEENETDNEIGLGGDKEKENVH